MLIYIEIPGEPIGKGRPRAWRKGNLIGLYPPKKTVNYETLIQEIFASKYPGNRPSEGPIYMTIRAFFRIPISGSRRKRDQMDLGKILPLKKPDLSNIVKAAEDALNGLAYRDDSQIVSLLAEKYYGKVPHLEIILTDGRREDL
jgi:Holliday junction resolvase RusA-like endonuclease